MSEKDEQEHSTKAGGTVQRHKVQLLRAGSHGHRQGPATGSGARAREAAPCRTDTACDGSRQQPGRLQQPLQPLQLSCALQGSLRGTRVVEKLPGRRAGEGNPSPLPSVSTSPPGHCCWDPAPSGSNPLPWHIPQPAPTPVPAPAALQFHCREKCRS